MEITKIDPRGWINATNYNVIFGAACQLINFYKKVSLLIQSPFRFSDLFLACIVVIHVYIYIDINHLLFFWSIILFKTIMSRIVVNMIWFYPSFR